MPSGNTFWMLWFSSMITRILCRPPSVADGGVPAPPVADALARPVLGDMAGLAVDLDPAAGVELQPAARRHAARPKAASRARLVGRMRPVGVPARFITTRV